MCMLLGMSKQLVYAFPGFYNKETICSNKGNTHFYRETTIKPTPLYDPTSTHRFHFCFEAAVGVQSYPPLLWGIPPHQGRSATLSSSFQNRLGCQYCSNLSRDGPKLEKFFLYDIFFVLESQLVPPFPDPP